MWTYLIKTCCSYDRLPFCFASSASLCLFVSFLCCYSNQKSYMSQLQTLNTSGSLSIKHSQLSAVTNIWLFMVTICILFVMIALHQYFPLQPSRNTIADTFLSTPPPSAPLLRLSGASWSRPAAAPGSACSCSGALAVTHGEVGR